MGESAHPETVSQPTSSGLRDTIVYSVSDRMLSAAERHSLGPSLEAVGGDDTVWLVFDTMSRVCTPATGFRVLRVHEESRLIGAAFLFRCRHWAKALFKQGYLHVPADFLRLPAHIWIRVGLCAEGIANPGFVHPDYGYDAVISGMLRHLQQNALGTIVIDEVANAPLHRTRSQFAYVSDGRIDLKDIETVDAFRASHNNLKRKVKWFTNKGGRIESVHGRLNQDVIAQCQGFVRATVRTSLVYSPFQDCFDQTVERTCTLNSERVVHFLAKMNGTLIGYHTFVKFGRSLRMIHGAFNRDLTTTHHAYENIILETVRYSLASGLSTVHFGPVFNETKRRMMTDTSRAALFFYSNNPIIRAVIPRIFPYTRMQSGNLLAFDR